jgi:hypothetical protein
MKTQNNIHMVRSAILGLLVIGVFFGSLAVVHAQSDESMESQALDTVFNGVGQSITDQLPNSVSGPIGSLVSYLEDFRIREYENALVKRATLEAQFNESQLLEDNQGITVDDIEQDGAVSLYSDAFSRVSFAVVWYKVQYTGWSIVVAFFQYWLLFYLVSILVAIGLVGKLYSVIIRR